MKEKLALRFYAGVKGGMLVAGLIFLILILNSAFAQNKPWVAPPDADNVKNPVAGNPSAIVEAKALYTTNCGPCHGEKGKGDGPAAAGLNPRPADHTSESVQKQTDGAIFWKLSEGRNPMPGYKKIFNEQQRWGLVAYIRTLAKGRKK
ncbi:MAG: c-type cytochrome [Sphingobacteriales bacterium]|nr:c-type cytochrome [Sphingobacteriales bacterium]